MTRPFLRHMKYLRLTTNDPYYNLAVEEYLFRYSDEDIFMLWQNRPSVIIGKNQNAFAEVNTESAAEKGISIVRRITGGGAVYHDMGNVNYTFITSCEKAGALNFAYFTRPVIEALGALGLTATLNGRNDILCGERKVSGNAQFSDGKRVLHHGTLLFDADLGELASILKVDKEKMRSKAVKSHSGRVANMASLLAESLSVEEFICHLEHHVCDALAASRLALPEDARLDELCARNRSEAWIFSEKRYLREYTLSKRKRFDFGTVSLELLLNGDVIERAVVTGDFFEVRPVREWEERLEGLTVAQMQAQDPSPYIHRMTAADLKDLLENG